MTAASEVAYLARALKAPRIPGAAATLSTRAREESWDYEAYLAAVLSEEVASRDTHGGQNRVKAARFPRVKTIDDFDFSFQRSVKRATIAHLAQLDFIVEASNVVFLGPPRSRACTYAAGAAAPPPTGRSTRCTGCGCRDR